MIMDFRREDDLDLAALLAEKARKLESEMRQILSRGHEIGMITSRFRCSTRA
jgi:hypothetical protein